jgi:CRP-like cAMP-binding protein
MGTTTLIYSGEETSIECSQMALFEAEINSCIAESVYYNPDAIAAVRSFLKISSYKAGTLLLKAGEIGTDRFHVLKGCVRQYYILDGEERTTFFYTEDPAYSSFSSAPKKLPSNYYLACTEDTILTVFSVEKEGEFFNKFPHLESLSRIATEEQLGDYQEMLAKYITSTPEERYLNLLKSRPSLLNRVPQYQLASYLGVKPESLSRIRKRIMFKI